MKDVEYWLFIKPAGSRKWTTAHQFGFRSREEADAYAVRIGAYETYTHVRIVCIDLA